MSEKIIEIDRDDQLSTLFGQLDSNIRHIENQYSVQVINRDGNVKLIGNEADISEAARAVQALLKITGNGQPLSDQTVRYVTSMVAEGAEKQLEELGGDGVCKIGRAHV